MTKAELRTQLQRTGLGTAAADVISQNESLRAGYAWVWNAAEWSFRKIDMGSLSVTAGDSTPTMPADFGTVTDIFDQDGYALTELDPDEFDRVFQPSVVMSLRGVPSAYKVVDRQVTLGPIPVSTTTFRWSYNRRVCHLDSVTQLPVAGFMIDDPDLPLWPVDHHMILVHHAAMLEHGLYGYATAATHQDLRDDAKDAMVEDLIGERATGRQVPAYRP